MEELKIELEVKKLRLHDLQILISKPFKNNRFPSDDEFLSLFPLIVELKEITAVIESIESTIDAIKHNSSL